MSKKGAKRRPTAAGKSRRGKRPARPRLLDACRLYLFAAMGTAVLFAARMLLPKGEFWIREALEAVWALLALALPAGLCLKKLKKKGRARRLRLCPPNIAQTVLGLLAMCLYVLFADDLTLLWGAVLEGWGMTPRLAAEAFHSRWELGAGIACESVLRPLCEAGFFFIALLAAWERRGTRYGAWASAALYASLGGDLTALPARFALGLSAAMLIASTGSWPLGAFCMAFSGAAQTAAGQLRAVSLDLSRFDALGQSLGGARGLWLLALETAFLGAGFFCIVKGVCAVKPVGGTKVRPRPIEIKALGAEEVFILTAGVITAAAILLADALQMCGILP